ncbi:hypothetical protein KC335_g6396 [Hortaea werneckii]|nr:hypothetical protein KC335_g6396 [Hortaea werneckii]
MSFGFGSNNNNSGSAFGGGGGFGSSNTGFGANNNASSGGSLFGGNTSTTGGFGGFGASNSTNTGNNSPFGASKPAFGAPATSASGGGGLFGSGTSTSGGFGGGGFGSNTGSTGSTPFSSGNTGGGGLFGASKPATGGFGSSNTGGSLFGGGSGTGNTFGSTATQSNPFSGGAASNTGGFGSGASTGGAFGSNTGGSTFGGFGGASTAGNNNNGTAAVPFNAFTEKEGNTATTNAYQSITFQDPYKNKSFEELRTEDYAQGRRYGNSNGQAGSFGQSTGFGGFGATNASSSGGGGLFGGGQQNNTPAGGSGFGGFGSSQPQQQQSNPFGSSASGGGLFGNQNKPASGGLFGNTASSGTTTGGFGSTAGSGGGLFGGQQNQQQQSNPFGSSTTNTGGGLFGSNQNQTQQPQSNPFGSSTTGGGLFGNNNNQQQQNKPAFGGFGSSTTNTGGGFGSNSGTGGGLFGSQNNQTQQQSNPFGSSTTNTGGGLFGNQNKPAGGGLFGNSTASNTNTGGGLFGNQNQSNTGGGGLFGNQNQNKPAGGGLFGGSTSNTGTGGSLFGNTQQNQNQGGGSLFGGSNTGGSSLFGNQNQNKPAGGSLFGNTGASNTGGSLFGNTQQSQPQNTGGSLFGGGGLGNSQQNQQNTGGSSLFGGSTQQQQPQNNQLTASLTGAPYGNEQLFASLAASSPPVGPLATPLNNARPPQKKTPSLMQSMRLNTPVYSPRASGSMSRNGGYGFSYSTYGTPQSSFSGSLTPGASSMLKPSGSFSSTLNSKLSKSTSMGNLGAEGTPGEGRPSLLRESALSPPGSGRFSSNPRKLTIDRSLRTDLFAHKGEDSAKKGVSFDRSAEQTKDSRSDATPTRENTLVRTEEESEEQERTPELYRSAPRTNGSAKQPEMSQVNGTNGALTTVPEDGAAATRSSQGNVASRSTTTNEPGEYFTVPALKDLKNMGREQLKNIKNFKVGRHNTGYIEWCFAPVDLSHTPLDEICGDIVRIVPRMASVYQYAADKPPQGQGLNHPAKVWLYHSYPRAASSTKLVKAKQEPALSKHINRLKKVNDSKFISFDTETGVWHFEVPHWSKYGLDEDDDESEAMDATEHAETSGLSEPPETPGQEETMQSIETADGEPDDDTFQFMMNRRSQHSVPGGFGEEPSVTYDYDDPSGDESAESQSEQREEVDDPFVSSTGGAVQAPSQRAVERYHLSIIEDEMGRDTMMSGALEDMDEDDQASPEMPGSFVPEPKMPRSILKPSTGLAAFASPEKLATESWEDQLQRTMSPKKRDRQALRDMQQSSMKTKDQDDLIQSPFKQSLFGQSTMDRSALGQSYLGTKSANKAKDGKSTFGMSTGKSQPIMTRMEMMNSLWEDELSGKKAPAGKKGFEYPYAKKARLSTSEDLSEQDAAFHDNLKPSFTGDGTLVYAASGPAIQADGILAPSMQPIVGEHKDIRFAGFVANPQNLVTPALTMQKDLTRTKGSEGSMPAATTTEDGLFIHFVEGAEGPEMNNGSTMQLQELAIWRLCSLLFDPIGMVCDYYQMDVPKEIQQSHEQRVRLDAFKIYLARLAHGHVEDRMKRAQTIEEKALLLLSRNDVAGACDLLVSVKDFRLATLVAQLPGTETTRDVMRSQIDAWKKRRDWSEMSEAIRALYCVLAGEMRQETGNPGSLEDRTEDFNISERFDLMWQQSFGLRVYYGGYETIADVVKAYCADFDTDQRESHPTPFYVHEMEHVNYENEDTLMGLLRMFSKARLNAEELLDPRLVSGSDVNARLAWQLASILGARKLVHLPEQKMAQLTYDYATQLELAGCLVESAWVLLHLPSVSERQKAVKTLLERNAGSISELAGEIGDQTLQRLIDLRIPKAMMFATKALYSKAMDDSVGQAHWLLQAGHAEEAHDVLCNSVGPQAVIGQDYVALGDLVPRFPKRKPAGWDQGGHIYADFLRLIMMPVGQRHGDTGEQVLRSLNKGLAGVEGGEKGRTLEQRVAFLEMRRYAEDLEREIGVGDEMEKDDINMMDASGFGLGAGMLENYRRALGQAV